MTAANHHPAAPSWLCDTCYAPWPCEPWRRTADVRSPALRAHAIAMLSEFAEQAVPDLATLHGVEGAKAIVVPRFLWFLSPLDAQTVMALRCLWSLTDTSS